MGVFFQKEQLKGHAPAAPISILRGKVNGDIGKRGGLT
jgi:hypothetical protein